MLCDATAFMVTSLLSYAGVAAVHAAIVPCCVAGHPYDVIMHPRLLMFDRRNDVDVRDKPGRDAINYTSDQGKKRWPTTIIHTA